MKKSKAQVQGTNDFNTVSKCSMIKNGYFRDDYVLHFVNKCNRRTPLIHLGYYMRVLTVDYTLRSFLNAVSNQPVQIISCGAGFDTSFFRLSASNVIHSAVSFFEVDFTEIVERKTNCILGSEALLNCIGSFEVKVNGTRGLTSSQYHLIASDLQALDKLESNLLLAGVKFSLPTLLLAECAICYMDEHSSSALIEWAASKFENATFVTYEQVYPDDGFGIVMQKHFESMNSPLLSLSQFPDLESQEQRYVSRGWKTCSVWTAFEMFQQIVSPEERLKIVTLEPFDELEEWHLEGCHFALMVASKGSLLDWFDKYADVPLHRISSVLEKSQVHFECVESSCGNTVNRFAQKSVKVSEVNGFDILVVGGFGPSINSLHGRRHELLNVYSRHQHLENVKPISWNLNIEEIVLIDGVKLDSLHHTCTHLSLSGPDGASRVMVYGGRSSPCKAVNSWPIILTLQQSDKGQRMTVAESESTSVKKENVPKARWRHSAVCLRDSSPSPILDNIIVFGGRTSEFEILGDLHVWTVTALDMNINCREVKCQTDPSYKRWPSRRFSHSATVWHENTMIVTGGLGEDVLPLRDIWFFSLETEIWNEFSIDGMLPRYSHTSTVCEDQLILIGGVNTIPGNQPGVCVVNLNTASCMEYLLPVQNPVCPIMLHNHTSEIVDDNSAVVVIGGGGNCFSFGTVFNNYVIRINLHQFR